ncbi:phosphoglycerate kinase [Halalkalicoccus jeotgali]|uniref:Phosphoglycerate kinase n=1 Tax=Halalkalicoccus jeotgali (strain DSM 18796 / CECT 7217 / JCM 14584 / KCTC 4019 / B3) TaxID=795797 RepID=D8J921_HALJB|nr:phosphoglycerate kinase [Halalkalicoccus jeotgali]ADJ16290.1 phosphoglycerate kinase [Halalkalicoccus jeotgali B3]ELY37024.1 phosphoglycerate kinase [Halalkalicoccus jeotgali B3]
MFKTLDDLPDSQRLLVRIDANSPVEDGEVRNNRRFARHAETLRELADAGHAVAVLAHQGRPGRDTFVSLEQHAEILSEHLDREVRYVPDTYGEASLEAIDGLGGGEVLLLENVRMVDEELADRTPEAHAESALVETLSGEFDAYVNDAYSTAHRGHASIVGFPRVMDAYAGRVMETEYEANSAIQQREFDGRVAMVLGGTKADDLIGVMERVEDTVDTFLMGGIVGELFLRAAGYDVGYDVEGTDFFDEQWAEQEETIRELLDSYGDRIRLPVDLAYEDEAGDRAEIAVEGVEKETSFLDVGSGTVEEYESVVADSEAVFVKGALGVFEDERFADGTVGVLEAIARTDCFSVVGGGDTSRAIELYGMDEDDFSHVSIAGGAYVRALTGESLVAIEALKR